MLVLASASASRKAMLSAAGITFDVCPADLDERALEAELGDTAPGEIAKALAVAKAVAVSREHPSCLVLGSDSVVTVEDSRFDKPASREEAAQHLRHFSGKRMHLDSAAALARDGECLWSDSSLATLDVIAMSDRFIDQYLDHEWPAISGCVGVFRIEGRGVQLFEAIEGDQFTVLGMPLLKVLGALRDYGELAS